MKHKTISLARFNDEAAAERALRILEQEGFNPTLVFGQARSTPGEAAVRGELDWIALEAPEQEADAAAAILDSILEDLDSDEEEELVLGQS